MTKNKLLLLLVLLLTAATGAWATDYTTLAVGDVIKVGDTFSPTADGAFNDYGVDFGKTYTLMRADVDNEGNVTEKTDGAYYVFKYVSIMSPYIHFEKAFAVKAISDGLEVTKIEDMKGMPSYTLALHESAAPATYAITLAEGTEDANKWTISPNPAEEGSPVTATYKGDKKVKSVKAVKKPVAEGHALTSAKLGEIVCSDGKAYAAADKDNLPKGVKAEALVCYVDGEHGLALAMADVKNEKMSWDNERGANDGKTAAEWCDGWNTSHPIAGATWLLASQTQWNNMISAAGSASNLRNAFSAVGGTNLQDFSYWSSTPHLGGTAAYFYYFPSSAWQWTYLNQDYTGKYIRACLEW